MGRSQLQGDVEQNLGGGQNEHAGNMSENGVVGNLEVALPYHFF
jgi:hypothetical protein